MPDPCQVDFYLLGSASQDPGRLACKLALMAWERGHDIAVITENQASAERLDELMWQYPADRFLPHVQADAAAHDPAPVQIMLQPPEGPADVVINLTERPLPGPLNFNRLLEIVPHAKAERRASREKFKAYRALGLQPAAHEIN